MSKFIVVSKNDELYHFGVKGMKWGVRHEQKRQARKAYRSAKVSAYNKYTKATSDADERYNKSMSKRTEALNKVNEKYNAKQKETDSFYKEEIQKKQRKIDSAKSDMDFWENGYNYDEAKSRYDKHSKDLEDTKSRYDSISKANKLVRDNESIKVRQLYSDDERKASDARDNDYILAGEQYAKDLKLAKTTYREAKKRIRNGSY